MANKAQMIANEQLRKINGKPRVSKKRLQRWKRKNNGKNNSQR
jgi:hypothetical protein